MTLKGRVTALLAAFSVLLVAVGVVLTVLGRQVVRDADVISQRWQPAGLAARSLLLHLVDQETGERGYIITGDAEFLRIYRAGRNRAAADGDALAASAAGDPPLVRLLAAVTAAEERWRQIGPEREIPARRAGNEDLARALVARGAGKAAFDELRSRVARLQAAIDARLERADHRLAQADATLTWIRTAGIVVLLALAMTTAALLRRWVLGPIAAIRRAMRRVAAGDWGTPVQVSGPVEIQELARDADAMRSRLIDELEKSRAAQEALELRGPVIARLREELQASTVRVPGMKVAGELRPAEGVLAGDWYDVLRLPVGDAALLITDVSGHGAEAGLVASRLKHVIVSALMTGAPPDQALALAATGFGQPDSQPESPHPHSDERFASCAIVVVDPMTGEGRWVNAGHPPPLLLATPSPRAGRTAIEVRALEPTGPVLSALPGHWELREFRMSRGEVLLAFSDGLTEARSATDEEFGEEGILQAFDGLQNWDPDTLVNACLAAGRAHAADWRRDDVTVVALTMDGSASLQSPPQTGEEDPAPLPSNPPATGNAFATRAGLRRHDGGNVDTGPRQQSGPSISSRTSGGSGTVEMARRHISTSKGQPNHSRALQAQGIGRLASPEVPHMRSRGSRMDPTSLMATALQVEALRCLPPDRRSLRPRMTRHTPETRPMGALHNTQGPGIKASVRTILKAGQQIQEASLLVRKSGAQTRAGQTRDGQTSQRCARHSIQTRQTHDRAEARVK